MNITPNSFSDGGEVLSAASFQARLSQMGPLEALDLGAESTAPMNSAISAKEEWERFSFVLPHLKSINCTLSIDTYHPETIFHFHRHLKDHHLDLPLIWNDVSGKFDQHVEEFLKADSTHQYVFCHNLCPNRDLSGRHMDYVSSTMGSGYLAEIKDFFGPYQRERVIFDPGLGFSKTYEQNWLLLDQFPKLQELVKHPHWLIGFSRKSFLRKKYGVGEITPENREKLDELHVQELTPLLKGARGELWIRTHRPGLLPK